MRKSKLFILLICLIILSLTLTGCSTSPSPSPESPSQFDDAIKQLIYSSITLYLLSMFIGFFDKKISSFLKQIAYLNAISILIIFGINLYALLFKFANALDRISQFKIFGN